MKQIICIYFFLFSNIVLNAQISQLEGNWIGHYELLGEKKFTFFSIDSTGSIEMQTPHNPAATHVEYFSEEENSYFGIARQGKTFFLKPNSITKEIIIGKVVLDQVEGNFIFYRRYPRISLEEQKKYLGYYATGSGVFKVWNRYNTFRIYSYITQTISPLYAIGGNRFYTIEGEIIAFDSKSEKLSWIYNGQNSIEGSKFIPYKIEELEIVSDEVKLTCSLYLPNGSEKTSGVVMLPGGGGLNRENYRLESELFAANGIASILCDKRGTGSSTGDVINATFFQLRDDAINQFNILRERIEIDPMKIGFRGPSQGGRIAIMAGSEVEEEAFIIATSAPIMSMKEGQVYANLMYARNLGVPETIAVRTANVWRQYYDQFKINAIQDNLIQDIQQLRSNYPSLHLPPPSKELPAGIISEDIDNDASTYLNNVNAPILFQYGSNDERVSPKTSIANIERALSGHGDDYLILNYANANHSLMLPGFKIAPGIFMDQIEWIKSKVEK